MSILKWQVNSSLNFALFLIVMTHNSLVKLKLIPFLLWAKESHQSPNFDTFMCSGKNLPYFSRLFWNHKSVFLKNLHNFSVSWKITPLYFGSSNNLYFGHKEQIKTNFFLDFWVLGSKFLQFLMSVLKRQVSSLSIFAAFFIVMTHNFTLNFYFGQEHPIIKVLILTFSSALVKIWQIPHVIFQAISQLLFKFCFTFSVMKDNISVLF